MTRKLQPYDYVVYENREDTKFPWSAYIESRPEVVITGVSPAGALTSLNIHLWHELNQRELAFSRCFTRLRREIRLAAGVHKALVGLHRWLLFGLKKNERNDQFDRMAKIVNRIDAEHGDLTWEQRTDLCIDEFNSPRL